MMTKSFASLLLALLLVLAGASSAFAQKRKSTVDLIISGGTVVTMDGSRRVIENGGVAIKGGRILADCNKGALHQEYGGREDLKPAGEVVITRRIKCPQHGPLPLFLR